MVDLVMSLLGYYHVSVSAVLKSRGVALVDQAVSVSWRVKGAAKWANSKTGTTNASGSVTGTFYLKKGSFEFQASFPGAGVYTASESKIISAVVP